MTCETVTLPNGATAIVCGPRRRPQRCSICKTNPVVAECDFPAPNRKSKTCDKKLCADCRVSVGDNVDYCKAHGVDRELAPGEIPPKVKAAKPPICKTCKTPAVKTDGAEIYPHRKDLIDKVFWKCLGCGGICRLSRQDGSASRHAGAR
jgi:hypothetical protein